MGKIPAICDIRDFATRTDDDIGSEYGVSRQRINQIRKRAGIPSARDVRHRDFLVKIKEVLPDCSSLAGIAEKTGIPRYTVAKLCRSNGLTPSGNSASNQVRDAILVFLEQSGPSTYGDICRGVGIDDSEKFCVVFKNLARMSKDGRVIRERGAGRSPKGPCSLYRV